MLRHQTKERMKGNVSHAPTAEPLVPVCLFVLMLGEGAWRSHFVPQFVASAGRSSPSPFELLLVGNPGPSPELKLAENMRFVNMSTSSYKSRLEGFLGSPVGRQGDQPMTSDVRPLFPAMYPKLFSGCEWIGWIEYDMLVSSYHLGLLSASLRGCPASLLPGLLLGASKDHVRRFFHHSSPPWSWGPITLMRADAYWNQILPVMRLPEQMRILQQVFGQQDAASFDEWGEFFHPIGYNASFSGFIEKARQLTNKITSVPEEQLLGNCAGVQCIKYTPSSSRAHCHLQLSQHGSHIFVDEQETLFCHFRERKHDPQDPCSTNAAACGRLRTRQ
ncbi:hypothetical protein AB1Y20_012980 [Prymnesium parvum]|uniref:Hexosyltransferase n=1 Tax=Prymnesium parvum TaxID=97485 RepID=A0AB34IJD4_PRYPA